MGGGQWLYKAIEINTLLCAADGSYIREIHPNLCAAAVIIKCSSGGGRLSLSFTDTSPVANAYRGELLGLMAIHLILYSADRTRPGLTGTVDIYSDCQGDLKTVEKLANCSSPRIGNTQKS
jgi:hypothetical protein